MNSQEGEGCSLHLLSVGLYELGKRKDKQEENAVIRNHSNSRATHIALRPIYKSFQAYNDQAKGELMMNLNELITNLRLFWRIVILGKVDDDHA
jgi:hypothetical protein